MKKRTLFLIVGGGLVFACVACLAIGLITILVTVTHAHFEMG
jgi:hypothetical protein